ncbi:GntR family transcriptional regulator [Roseixanthobacter pseudopolyaromaticivorans]|uniref:GntR family transcriptional regulator n=1 Tax=Xanthobacteraceae TaxID=335928 RepID=UPI003726EB5E
MATARGTTRQKGTRNASAGKSMRAIPASARIHRALREQIVGMEIAPGALLQEKQIALACGVSRTPVREALLKLADERLVDIFPQYGTFVARISIPAIHDAMVIREALERAAVRAAAACATAEDIATLRGLLVEQRALHEAGRLPAFHAADETFHQTISEVAGHPNLWRVIRQEKAHVDRCRILTLPQPGRRAGVVADHAAIVDAIASGNPDAAEQALLHHLGKVLPSVAALVEAHPTYFEESSLPPEPPPSSEPEAHCDQRPVEPAPRHGTGAMAAKKRTS